MAKNHIYLLTAVRSAARIPLLRAAAVRWSKWRHREGRVVAAQSYPGLNGVDDIEAHVQRLRKTGFSEGLSLDASVVHSLKQKFLRQTLTEDCSGRSVSAAQAAESGSSAAFRWLNPHLRDDMVRALAHDERLIAIARSYLGCTPILHSTQIWLLNPPSASAASSPEYGWHYDIDDFRFLKVFFYLTDTSEVNGQHMLVSCSHRDLRPHRFIQRRIPDQKLRIKYAEADIRRMEGAAGDGFLEDTWLYHKATPPTGQRIMMQIEYCATGAMKSLERHR